MTATLTLIGRPGRVRQAGDCVLTTWQSSGKLSILPTGLPEPPTQPMALASVKPRPPIGRLARGRL